MKSPQADDLISSSLVWFRSLVNASTLNLDVSLNVIIPIHRASTSDDKVTDPICQNFRYDQHNLTLELLFI